MPKNMLFKSITTRKIGVEHVRRKTLTPLDIEGLPRPEILPEETPEMARAV
jgi:hypothetical protein